MPIPVGALSVDPRGGVSLWGMHIEWGSSRFTDFSLLGAKVPTENFRSRERKFSGTFAAGNGSSRKLSLPGLSFSSKQVRFLTTVIDIYNTHYADARCSS